MASAIAAIPIVAFGNADDSYDVDSNDNTIGSNGIVRSALDVSTGYGRRFGQPASRLLY